MKRFRLLFLSFALFALGAHALPFLAPVIPITVAASAGGAATAISAEATALVTLFGAIGSWLAFNSVTQSVDGAVALSGPKIAVQVDPSVPPPMPAGWVWEKDVSLPGYALLPSATMTPQQVSGGGIVLIYTNSQVSPSSKRISPEFATITEAGSWYAELNNCLFSGTTYCWSGTRRAYPDSQVWTAHSWEEIAAELQAYIAAGRPIANLAGYDEYQYRYVTCSGSAPAGHVALPGYAPSCTFILEKKSYPSGTTWTQEANYFSAPYTATDLQQCYPGYVLQGTTCVRTDAALAAQSVPMSADGICPVVWSADLSVWYKNPFDPDCANAPSLTVAGASVDFTQAGGQQVRVTRQGTVPVPGESPAVDIDRVTPDPGTGTTKHEKARVQPPAPGQPPVVQNITNHYYPGVGPSSSPLTPAQPAPTPLPQTVVANLPPIQFPDACGAPGQPACAIDPGSPVDAVPASMPGTDALDYLKTKTLPVSSVCPADAFSFSLPFPAPIGTYQLSDSGVFCNVMGQYQEVIRMISIAAGWIAALFIVLRA